MKIDVYNSKQPFIISSILIFLLSFTSLRCENVQPTGNEAGTQTFTLRDLSTEESAFLVIINDYRTSNGKGTLTASRSINQAAYDHSLDMGQLNYFEHTGLDGSSPWDRMCRAGHTPACTGSAYMGENIAAGNASAYDTFIQWKNSPGHNRNMLDDRFKAIGIGRATVTGSIYTYYWTTDFSSIVDNPVCECSAGDTQPCSSECGSGVIDCPDGCNWGACNAPTPTTEICDGADNDCDGLTDEDGVCGPDCTPTGEEICDGIDNDCDGLTDEDDVCGACVPELEICDGTDNNCDGQVDEGGVCETECVDGQTRPCGMDRPPCTPGIQTCLGGIWGICEGAVIPEDEVCDDGIDNNCNGVVDDCGVDVTSLTTVGGCGCSIVF